MDDDDCEDLEIWEDVQEEFHGFDSVQKKTCRVGGRDWSISEQ